jgi:hypothetical protein
MPIRRLCLYIIILFYLNVIVFVMESSSSGFSRRTTSKEYPSKFGDVPMIHQIQDFHGSKPITRKHNLIDTPIFSKNAINDYIGTSSKRADNQKYKTSPSRSNNNNNTSKNGLQIAWLMSFPNSGTSYTSRLVRDMTQTFTASNYADETPEGLLGERIPVYTNDTYGPFWTIPVDNKHYYQYPKQYVLTKTHCGLRCSICSPVQSVETTYSFRRRCLETKWIEIDSQSGHAKDVFSKYPITHVEKAVHIVRNPFDNVVSRFHLEQTHPNHTAKDYSRDRDGFLQYCLSIAYKYEQQEVKYMHFRENKVLQDLWLVPCHADFMRYIEWHNLAFITTNDLKLPTYVLHYDWYSTQYERVTKELLQFLQLTPTAVPPPFVPGKVYDHYYTTQEKLIVKRAFEFMASSETWQHIQQYFPSNNHTG